MDFLTNIDPHLIEKLQAGGYIIMFILMFLEGPLITIISAFLASLGFFNIYFVAILGWAGDFIGDVAFFMIGKYGLRLFQKKTAIDTPEEESFITRIDTLIKNNLMLSVIIIKLTPYAPFFAFPYMGRSGVSLKKFAIIAAVTSIPVPVGVALIGYHVSTIQSFWHSSTPEEIILYGITSCLGLILIWYIFHSLWKRYGQIIREYTSAGKK